MRRVIIESPYAGDVERNLIYLRRALRDSLLRGEAPIASHAIYTQPGVLRDDVLEERALGIAAGFEWWFQDQGLRPTIIFYVDYEFSVGMQAARQRVLELGFRFDDRRIGVNP